MNGNLHQHIVTDLLHQRTVNLMRQATTFHFFWRAPVHEFGHFMRRLRRLNKLPAPD